MADGASHFVSPPHWLAGRTWYQVYPLGALGAPAQSDDPGPSAPVEHRLGRLIDWLDHVRDLGAGGLLLNPIFASLTHGYDTFDPFRIDHRLGDQADVAALIEAAHQRDLRVLFDGVFNHVSRAFPAFREVIEMGRDAPRVDWFHVDFDHDGRDGFAYRDFEGHPELVALNHDNPEVLDWAVSVAGHWLERGIDGWRLDVAYAPPRKFWAGFSSRVRERFPEAWLVGEMIHGDYAGFVRASGLHSVTQYELYKALWSSINDANFFELGWALKRHREMCEVFVPLTFVDNHDVTRILSQLENPDHLGHALAALFTLPGSPSFYYGDELALRGVKEARPGGDDAIRPPLPDWSPGDPERDGVLELCRTLIGLRRQRPWLTSGTLEVVDLSNQSITYTVAADGHRLLVALNVGATSSARPPVGGNWRQLAGAPLAAGGPLAAHTWAIFESL